MRGSPLDKRWNHARRASTLALTTAAATGREATGTLSSTASASRSYTRTYSEAASANCVGTDRHVEAQPFVIAGDEATILLLRAVVLLPEKTFSDWFVKLTIQQEVDRRLCVHRGQDRGGGVLALHHQSRTGSPGGKNDVSRW